MILNGKIKDQFIVKRKKIMIDRENGGRMLITTRQHKTSDPK